MINLNQINYDSHSIAIKETGNGYELGIDSEGKLSVKIEDNGNSITVDAIDLDIRDLNSANDSVAAVQSGTWDIGTLGGITNDVNIADGGNSITIDDGGSSITVDGTLNTVPGGFGTWKVTDEDVTSTESELVSTPLADRQAIEIQNLSSNDIFIKEVTGVSVSNGFMIPKKSSWEAKLDAAANIFAIAAIGTNDVRIAEFAA